MLTALRGMHAVVVRSSWHALSETLAQTSIDGCVVDADHPSRDEARREIEAIHEQYPGLAIIAYADVAGELEYYDLGELGVDGVLLAGRLEADEIRNLVDQALAANSAIRIVHELEGQFSTVGSRAVAWAIEHARSEPSVEQFAAAMGRSPRMLVSALHRDSLPSPKTLLLWGRLLRAGTYLGRDRCTVEETAFLLGYSTASSLARAMKKNTGFTAGEVAAQGGLTCVQTALFAPARGAPAKLKVLPLALAICFQVGWRLDRCYRRRRRGPRGDQHLQRELSLGVSRRGRWHRSDLRHSFERIRTSGVTHADSARRCREGPGEIASTR